MARGRGKGCERVAAYESGLSRKKKESFTLLARVYTRVHARPRYEASLRPISNGLHRPSANVKFDVHDYCGPPGRPVRIHGQDSGQGGVGTTLDVNFIILAKKLRPSESTESGSLLLVIHPALLYSSRFTTPAFPGFSTIPLDGSRFVTFYRWISCHREYSFIWRILLDRISRSFVPFFLSMNIRPWLAFVKNDFRATRFHIAF